MKGVLSVKLQPLPSLSQAIAEHPSGSWPYPAVAITVMLVYVRPSLSSHLVAHDIAVGLRSRLPLKGGVFQKEFKQDDPD